MKSSIPTAPLPEILPCPNPECKGKCMAFEYPDQGNHYVGCMLECGYYGPNGANDEEAIRLHNLLCRPPVVSAPGMQAYRERLDIAVEALRQIAEYSDHTGNERAFRQVQQIAESAYSLIEAEPFVSRRRHTSAEAAVYAAEEIIYNYLPNAAPPENRDMLKREIAAIIRRHTGKDGWVMVPREPTEAMLAASENPAIPAVYVDSSKARRRLEATAIYKAMIDAAPDRGGKSA